MKKEENMQVGGGIWDCNSYVPTSLFVGYLVLILAEIKLHMLPKYQPKRGGDLGWGKLFWFKCGIKNYFQLAKTNLRTQFNCNKIW